jgi:hypothetical protein
MAFGDFTVTRASTKNVLGSAGLYVSVANNVPAFEFNTDGTYRGLLVEPGATNLLLRSQEFGATWTTTDITVTSNSIVAPDGATTADTITEGTAGTAITTQVATVSSGATTTFSIFLKVGSANDFVRLFIGDSAMTANRVETFFQFSTGTLSGTANQGTATGASASVQALPNGWYRVSLSGAIPSVTSYRVAINSASASGSGTRVNNSVYYLWQAQLETGSVATSPIVTTAGTASRVADSVSLTGASSLIGQTEGTLYVESEYKTGGIDGARILEIVGSNSNDNRVILIRGASSAVRIFIETADEGQADFTSTTNNLTGVFRTAVAYKENDIALYVNGVANGTDNSALIPVCDKIYIGNQNGNVNHLNGWIRSVALFPTRLANATLASITA